MVLDGNACRAARVSAVQKISDVQEIKAFTKLQKDPPSTNAGSDEWTQPFFHTQQRVQESARARLLVQ